MSLGWYQVVDKKISSLCVGCCDFCPHNVYEYLQQTGGYHLQRR